MRNCVCIDASQFGQFSRRPIGLLYPTSIVGTCGRLLSYVSEALG